MKFFHFYILLFLLIFTSSCFKEDTISPIITLKGARHVFIPIGTDYTEYGATALDDIDGDISYLIKTNGEVNIHLIGEYQIKYNVIDASGNASDEVVRYVYVQHTGTTITGFYLAKHDALDPDSTGYPVSIKGDNSNSSEFKIQNITGYNNIEMKANFIGNIHQSFLLDLENKNDTSYSGSGTVNNVGNLIYITILKSHAQGIDSLPVILKK